MRILYIPFLELSLHIPSHLHHSMPVNEIYILNELCFAFYNIIIQANGEQYNYISKCVSKKQSNLKLF